MIDWPALLRSHGIEFVESGPKVSRGNILVDCPWCGDHYKGYPMLGISLKGKGWGCWRNQQHRGKSPRRLLSGLLGIGISQAQALLDGSRGSLGADDEISRKVKAMRSGDDDILIEGLDELLVFPDEIKPIQDQGPGRHFIGYLRERGWSKDEAAVAIWRYKLRYAFKGAFSYRLVIPIFNIANELVTWTGRTIAPDIEPRYKTLSLDPEKAKEEEVPVARANIKDCLFGEQDILTKMGRGLIVCEGPLDAIRVDQVGRSHGVMGTCLFGKTFSDDQIDKLAQASPYFGKKLLLLDQDASMDAYRMIERVRAFGYQIARLPRKYKDPGEMPMGDIEDFIRAKM